MGGSVTVEVGPGERVTEPETSTDGSQGTPDVAHPSPRIFTEAHPDVAQGTEPALVTVTSRATSAFGPASAMVETTRRVAGTLNRSGAVAQSAGVTTVALVGAFGGANEVLGVAGDADVAGDTAGAGDTAVFAAPLDAPAFADTDVSVWRLGLLRIGSL